MRPLCMTCARHSFAASRATFGVLPRTFVGRLSPGGHTTFHAHQGGVSWRAFSSGSQEVKFGKHKGLTFEELATQEPGYVKWLLTQVQDGKTNPMWDEFVHYLHSRQGGEEGLAAAAEQKPSGKKDKKEAKHDVSQAASGGSQGSTSSPDGSTVLAFGKHKGRTYQEMLDNERNYCQWTLDQAEKEPEKERSAGFKDFLAFLRANMSTNAKQSGGGNFNKGASRSQGGWSPGQAPVWNAKNQPGPLAGGRWVLGFGKHQGKTFETIFNEDQQYCEWMAKSAMEGEDRAPSQQVLSFTAYVQDRWLRG